MCESEHYKRLWLAVKVHIKINCWRILA